MNTVPQYENAKYDVMWFASSRIKGESPANAIEIEPIPDNPVAKYRAEGLEWVI